MKEFQVKSEPTLSYVAENKLNLTLNNFMVNSNTIKIIAKNFLIEENFINKNKIHNQPLNSEQSFTKLVSERKNIEQANIAVDSIITIYDSIQRPIAYIVNLLPTGYCVLAATLKVKPVLSFSDSGRFSIENVRKNDNEKIWWAMKFMQIVDLLNDTNYLIRPEVIAEWMQYGIADTIITFNSSLGNNSSLGHVKNVNLPNVYIDPGCQLVEREVWYSVNLGVVQIDTNITIGPLLSITWNQDEGYNNFCPYLGCADYTNGNAPVGCVAIAVGQIMKYWFNNFTNRTINMDPLGVFSSSFNFSIMPNKIAYSSYSSSNSGHTQLNRFLAEIGEPLLMDYGCSGSGATDLAAHRLFASNFNANYRNYNFSVVENEIRQNRPVYMGAYTDYYCLFGIDWLCWGTGNGHAWVIDGFRQISHTVQIYTYPEIIYVQVCGDRALSVKNKIIIFNDTQPKKANSEAINRNVTTTTKYLHHNWGWGMRYNNWYVDDDDRISFRYSKDIITVSY